MPFFQSGHARRRGQPSVLRTSLSNVHSKIPYFRALPYASIEIILIVALANILVWIAAAIVLHFYPRLGASSLLAYTLGLRHALDADHISAIDLTTRHLLASRRNENIRQENGEEDGAGNQENKPKPVVTVGMWFSLGHSTIVIITTILVAATTAGISAHFDAFSTIGGIIGSSVSTAFLLLLGAINAWLLWKGIQGLKGVIKTERARIGSEEANGYDLDQGLDAGTNDHSVRQQELVDQQTQDANVELISVIPSSMLNKDTTKTAAAVSKPTGMATATELEQVVSTTKSSKADKKSNPQVVTGDSLTLNLPNRSCLSSLLRWCLRLIDKPWKIYPLGVLFGLGFDTSSEIALLGITTLEASRSQPTSQQSKLGSSDMATGSLSAAAIWAILIFPLLFTAGMCLLDTTDGALMYALYSRTTSRDSSSTSLLASSYANVLLTGFTVFVALGVGILQMLNMLSNVLPDWRIDQDPQFWDGVAAIGDRYDIIGGIVCGGFLVVAVSGWAGYKRWKSWILARSTRYDDRSTVHHQPHDDDETQKIKVDDVV